MNRREESLRAEIQDHLERETEDNIANGMSPADARLAALRKFGPVLRASEDTRAVWIWTWLEQFWHDLRHGARVFAKNPGFTLVAVISLAFGIGANCAMFSAADALLLRPLPVAHPEEIVTVGSVAASGFGNSLNASYPDYLDIRNSNRSFTGVTASVPIRLGIAADRSAIQQVKVGAVISANFFGELGVEPALGRSFRDDENEVVILSYGTWQQQFDANPAVLGRKIPIAGIDFTIVGVAPERFGGLDKFRKSAYFIPLSMWPKLSRANVHPLESRLYRALTLKARLKPGISLAQARAELTALGHSTEQPNLQVRTEFEDKIAVDQTDTELIGLLTFLALAVLFVACANVAGLLTSRAPVRAREIALRLAIGAGRARLIRQLLTESLMIAAAGELLSIPVAYLGIVAFSQIHFPQDGLAIPPMYLDRRAMLFSLAVGFLSSVVFELTPALKMTRADLAGAVKQSNWGRNSLVTAQVALSLVLLTLATFADRAFRAELSEGMGFRPDHIVMMSFDTPSGQRFYNELLDNVRANSGVKSAAFASSIPLSYRESLTVEPEGFRFPSDQIGANVVCNHVSDGYFDAMNIALIGGRAFAATDTPTSPRVAVINQTFAQHYWPGQDPVGKRFRIAKGPWVEIVGVTRTGRYLHIAEPPSEFVYLASAQEPRNQLTLIAHVAGDSASMIAPLRELVRSIDSNQPVYDVHTMEDFYWARATSVANVISITITVMGLMGLGLAMVGLYGLVAYAVARRTREIGIRMAIGAARSAVLGMILRQGLLLVGYGLAAGLALSVAIGRVLPRLFPIGYRIDSATYVAVPLVLLMITAVAVLIPARRASRVDPVRALRYE